MTNTALLKAPPKALGAWFLILAALVPVISVIGALTRLTQSGLSMMEWDFHHVGWPSAEKIDEYYALYQQVPQYLITGFTREEFVLPVFWEWFHRNWARLIGLVALFGALWFFIRRQVPRQHRAGVLLAPVLIGIQGAVGWFMVYSGFNTLEDVSHYRLALHLSLAFFACGFFLWSALRIFVPQPAGHMPLWPWAIAFGGLCLTMVFGAFTAGLNAWEMSHTWPHFSADSFLPPLQCTDLPRGDLAYWINSKCGVHFIHRHLAEVSALLVIFASALTLTRVRDRRARRIATGGLVLVLAQITLGIWLVLNPVPRGAETLAFLPAAAHQLGALALLAVSVVALYFRRRT